MLILNGLPELKASLKQATSLYFGHVQKLTASRVIMLLYLYALGSNSIKQDAFVISTYM